MNSRERLQKVFNGEKVDRVPISLYEFDGFYDDWIYDYPEYVEILNYAKGKTDKMYFWSPEFKTPHLFYGEINPDDYKNRKMGRRKRSSYKNNDKDTSWRNLFSFQN